MGSGLQRVTGPSDDGSDLPLQAGREIRILRTAVRCGTLVALVRSRSCLVRTSRQTAPGLPHGGLAPARAGLGGRDQGALPGHRRGVGVRLLEGGLW